MNLIAHVKKLSDESLFAKHYSFTRKRLREVNIKSIPDLINSNIKPLKMTNDIYQKIKLKAKLRNSRLLGKKPSYKIIDEAALKMLPKKQS